jgi:hypothetical protein
MPPPAPQDTCDQLAVEGIDATAVVISDDGNRDTAVDLGFAHVTRGNEFVSAKFNDGIQAALDPYLTDPPMEAGRYEVLRGNGYRGHPFGTVFQARLTGEAERRAVIRGDINVLAVEPLVFDEDTFVAPDGWDGRPADYVVPCGSDDWVDHRLFLELPGTSQIMTFRIAAFVREDGQEISSKRLLNYGGVGIRIYPRQLLEAVKFRPADEDRKRACDTSILVNVTNANKPPPVIREGDLHAFQIVDWKTPGEQLNDFKSVTSVHRQGTCFPDPFSTLAGVYPDDAVEEMRAHYQRTRQPRTVAA